MSILPTSFFTRVIQALVLFMACGLTALLVALGHGVQTVESSPGDQPREIPVVQFKGVDPDSQILSFLEFPSDATFSTETFPMDRKFVDWLQTELSSHPAYRHLQVGVIEFTDSTRPRWAVWPRRKAGLKGINLSRLEPLVEALIRFKRGGQAPIDLRLFINEQKYLDHLTQSGNNSFFPINRSRLLKEGWKTPTSVHEILELTLNLEKGLVVDGFSSRVIKSFLAKAQSAQNTDQNTYGLDSWVVQVSPDQRMVIVVSGANRDALNQVLKEIKLKFENALIDQMI